MNNEKCGACGSRKTSVLGKDKRIGKTCGNEDCKLHLSLIDWPPTKAIPQEIRYEGLEAEVTRLREVEKAANDAVSACYTLDSTIPWAEIEHLQDLLEASDGLPEPEQSPNSSPQVKEGEG